MFSNVNKYLYMLGFRGTKPDVAEKPDKSTVVIGIVSSTQQRWVQRISRFGLSVQLGIALSDQFSGPGLSGLRKKPGSRDLGSADCNPYL